MATTKIDIKNAINPDWLETNKYTVILPKNKVHRVRLVAILYNNTSSEKTREKDRQFLKVTSGIEDRTLRKFRTNNFAFNATTVGKKIMESQTLLDEYKAQSFIVEVEDNSVGLIKYHFRVNLNKAEEFNVVKPKPILDMNKVADIRQREIEKPGTVFTSEEQKEDVARQICETMASGTCSINEACDRYNVKVTDFAQWYGVNEYIRQMFIEASVMAKFFNANRQISQIDKIINELLITRETFTETITYSKLYNNKNPDGIWIEDRKQITRRQIDEKGLVMLKQMVKDINAPNFGFDEYDVMDELDLLGQVKEIDKRVNKQIELKMKNDENKV